MQDSFLTELEKAISADRLSGYRRPNAVEDDADIVARYIWNGGLSEALYPALQNLEVALRNSVHDAISGKFGTPYWFDANPSILHPTEQAAIDEAKSKITTRRKTIEPGRIVAEMNFGFWHSLFYSRYEQALWPELLKAVFPHVPARMRTRRELFERTNRIRNLRNRVFHYEPIWQWPGLRQLHTDILDTIGWINPELQRVTKSVDRFGQVYRDGPAPFRAKLDDSRSKKRSG